MFSKRTAPPPNTDCAGRGALPCSRGRLVAQLGDGSRCLLVLESSMWCVAGSGIPEQKMVQVHHHASNHCPDEPFELAPRLVADILHPPLVPFFLLSLQCSPEACCAAKLVVLTGIILRTLDICRLFTRAAEGQGQRKKTYMYLMN